VFLMRSSVAAFALILRDAAAGRVEYLAQWNDGWNAFHFIGGHKRDSESFHDCCVRETAEELGLVEGPDFRVAAERRHHLRYVHFSERVKVDTDYTVELFDVELVGDAVSAVEVNLDNRWLTESDLRTGRCRDGRAVSPTMLRILALAGLAPHEFDLFVSNNEKSSDLSFPCVWSALKGRGPSLVVLDNLGWPELLGGAKRLGVLPAGDAVHFGEKAPRTELPLRWLTQNDPDIDGPGS
jgi:8-oxo-dGTP pyrophosphatase MutT (NUDIX family)